MPSPSDFELEKWLADRPESVKALAREFPPGTVFIGVPNNTRVYVLGYTENDVVICSRVNPAEDYAAATKKDNRLYMHADCIRTARVDPTKGTKQ